MPCLHWPHTPYTCMATHTGCRGAVAIEEVGHTGARVHARVARLRGALRLRGPVCAAKGQAHGRAQTTKGKAQAAKVSYCSRCKLPFPHILTPWRAPYFRSRTRALMRASARKVVFYQSWVCHHLSVQAVAALRLAVELFAARSKVPK